MMPPCHLSLPPEILLKVFEYNMPLDAQYYREGYRKLLRYSLVDRTWRRVAQAKLFESVVLNSAATTRQLFAAAEGTAGMLEGIRYLRFRQRPSRQPSVEAPREGPWTSLSGLVEVRVENAVLRFDRIAVMKSIRQLHLQFVLLPDDLRILPPPGLPFPHLLYLEHLSLVDLGSYSDDAWVLIISPSILPALRSITLILKSSRVHIAKSAEHGVAKALSSIGPQIVSLAIFDSTDEQALARALASCLPRFTSLETFVILGQRVIGGRAFDKDSQIEQDVFAALPTSLRSLTVLDHVALPTKWPVFLHPLLASLQSDAPGLRHIKRISIPRSPPLETWISLGSIPTWSMEDVLMRVELRSLAAARQFDLDETGATPDLAASIPSWHDPSWRSY